MGRPKNSIPKLLSDSQNRAFTKVDGRFFSLGRAGTPEAQERYAEILRLHATRQLNTLAKQDVPAKAPATLTINELFVQFVAREIPRYSESEAYNFRTAIRVCRELFGETKVADFGPIRFRAMRDAMVSGDEQRDRNPWCRKTANRQAKRIRQIFPRGNWCRSRWFTTWARSGHW